MATSTITYYGFPPQIQLTTNNHIWPGTTWTDTEYADSNTTYTTWTTTTPNTTYDSTTSEGTEYYYYKLQKDDVMEKIRESIKELAEIYNTNPFITVPAISRRFCPQCSQKVTEIGACFCPSCAEFIEDPYSVVGTHEFIC